MSSSKCKDFLCYETLEPEFSLNSLPKRMFHIGDDLFVTVDSFNKQIQINVQVYLTDNNGYLYPTKEAISLTPNIWNSLLSALQTFPSDSDSPDAVHVVKRGVCIFNETENFNKCVSLQKLYQTSNKIFHLLGERIVLKGHLIKSLCDLQSQIFDCLKSLFLTCTLKEYVFAEYPKKEKMKLQQGFEELENSLCKCLLDSISQNISILSKNDCDYCKKGYFFNMDVHNCMLLSKKHTFEVYFERALYNVDWFVLAVNFVTLNRHCPFQEKLFLEMDIEKFYSKLKEMYENESSIEK